MSNPCQREACNIQECIQKNNYDDSKCVEYINKLYKCCANFYKTRGNDARSVCCPLPDLLQLKLQQAKDSH